MSSWQRSPSISRSESASLRLDSGSTVTITDSERTISAMDGESNYFSLQTMNPGSSQSLARKSFIADVEKGVEEVVWLEADARKREADTREQTQKLEDLELVTFRPEGFRGDIQPEIWPTEFGIAKHRIQYDPEKIHFAICGSSGSGKSSVVNIFPGLKDNSPHAAHTGMVETTQVIARYPDPRKEMPYNRLVWFDCLGAGMLV